MHRKPPVLLTPKIPSLFCSILGRLVRKVQLGCGIRATPEVQSTRRRQCRRARSRAGYVTKTGLRYDNEYCMVFRIENGKIKLTKEYCDSALVERVLGPFPEARKRATC
jgi:hypothetical protein